VVERVAQEVHVSRCQAGSTSRRPSQLMPMAISTASYNSNYSSTTSILYNSLVAQNF